MSLIPKNWDAFQHYKNRSPAWIKLHRGLLDDFAFSRLPVASRALAPLLWLLASEYDDGKITANLEEISFRIRMTIEELADAIRPLIDTGFFVSDSAMLAPRKRDAIPEERRREEKQEEKEEEIRAVAKATRPDRNQAFENFWMTYPKRYGGNPKAPAKKLFDVMVKSGIDPEAIIAGARNYATDPTTKVGTEFVKTAEVWLRKRCWEDYAAPPQGPPPVVTGWRPGLPTAEELRAKYERPPNGRSDTEAGSGVRQEGSRVHERPTENPGQKPEGRNLPSHQARHGRMEQLGAILPRTLGLRALGDEASEMGSATEHDGADPVA